MRPLDPSLRPLLRPARAALAGVVAAGVLSGALVVAQAFAVGTLLVRLVGQQSGIASGRWQDAALWVAVLIGARAVTAYAGDLCASRASGQVSTALRRIVVDAALVQDPNGSAPRRTGELTALATRGVAAVDPYLTRYLPTLVLATVLPLATTATIWWMDWLSGLIVILTLPLIPVFAILIGLATKDRADRQFRRLTDLSGHFLDVVRGLPTLVAHRRATAQSRSIRAITDRYRAATLDTLKIAFASSAALELIATISVALVAVSIGLRLAAGGVDFETAMIVLLLAPEAYWPLRRVGAEFHAAAEGTAALTQVRDLGHAVGNGRDADGREAGRDQAPPIALPITLTEVTFTHPHRTAPSLAPVSATIPAVGLTAVTGASGAGKSTLLDLLTGQLHPTSGSIRVGDTDLRDRDPDAWRAAVAWAPQRPWLTDGTIADNLRIGAPDADESALLDAVRRVGLEAVIAALPAGLNTPLGEDGAGLSAGQRARVALARILVSNRPFVIVDEPTAHVDAETEAVLVTTLSELARDRCVVVVAHREAVTQAADHVIELVAPAARLANVSGTVTPLTLTTSRPSRPEAAVPDSSGKPRRQRSGTLLGTLLGTGSVASGVALTATASWLITRAADQPPVLTLMVAIVGVRTFGLARPALRYAERLVSHDAALRLLAERRAAVYDALVPLVPGRLGRRRGDLLTTIVDDVDSLVDRRLRVRQPIVTALAVGALSASLAATQSIAAAGVIFGFTLLALATLALSYQGGRSAEPAYVATRARLSSQVEAVVHQARPLVAWGAWPRARAQIEASSDALARAATSSQRWSSLSRSVLIAGAGGGLLAMASLLDRGAPTTGPAMTALLVMVPLALLDAFSPLPEAGALAVRTAAAQRRLSELAALAPAVRDPAVPTRLDESAPEVRSVGVAAGWGDGVAFRDLDVRLAHGHRLGLVGPSGCGKSTYAAVCLRFLDPQAGHQELAGVDLRSAALDDVRRLTGFVDDDPYLFGSTVVENIRLARPHASDRDVERALRAAHLGEWISSLPIGLDTRIGDGGADVSGGERARLAIARVLLADPPVLVLDEPTAHLDAATASALADQVLAGRSSRSILWITHGTIGLDRMDAIITMPDPTGPPQANGPSQANGPTRADGAATDQSGAGGTVSG